MYAYAMYVTSSLHLRSLFLLLSTMCVVCPICTCFWKFSLPCLKQDSVGDKSAAIGSGEIGKDYVTSKDPEVGGLLVVTCNSFSSVPGHFWVHSVNLIVADQLLNAICILR